jgi:hypothetical protein
MSSRTTAWLLMGILLALSACRKSRHDGSQPTEIATTADSLSGDSPEGWNVFDESKSNFNIQETDFDYLTAKAKFSFRNDKQDVDNATINFRVKKDSLIWFSVTAVGFEVARGIISPQEMIVLDKFNKDYYAFTYPELSRRFQFALSYPLLQAVLVGNLPFPRQPGQQLYQKSDHDRLLLRQKDGQAVLDNFIGESSYRLESLRVIQLATQNVLTLDYDEFKNLDGLLFPFASSIVLNAGPTPDLPKTQTTIGLTHSKVDLAKTNPGFPFSIPSSYKKR